MTIAACYVSTEGVVFGADSTSSIPVGGEEHYFNHAQKIFEVGDRADIAAVTWGLGNLRTFSYRTLFALFADALRDHPPASIEDAAQRFADGFWHIYEAEFGGLFVRPRELVARARTGAPLTPQEEAEVVAVSRFACGFCIGGKLLPDRQPAAFQIIVRPLDPAPPRVERVREGQPVFWGVPNMLERLIYGVEFATVEAILASGHWAGTQQQLVDLVLQNVLNFPPLLPVRDAVDLVYSSISTTIKALKFSQHRPVCGGPIEVAVITSDRPFRWVRHKNVDAALG